MQELWEVLCEQYVLGYEEGKTLKWRGKTKGTFRFSLGKG